MLGIVAVIVSVASVQWMRLRVLWSWCPSVIGRRTGPVHWAFVGVRFLHPASGNRCGNGIDLGSSMETNLENLKLAREPSQLVSCYA